MQASVRSRIGGKIFQAANEREGLVYSCPFPSILLWEFQAHSYLELCRRCCERLGNGLTHPLSISDPTPAATPPHPVSAPPGEL